jgi:hypothetical protein
VRIPKVLRRAGPHIGKWLLLFVVLAYESRGVELSLRGLNVEHLLPPDAPNLRTAVLADAEATHLDGMLRSLTFPGATTDEKVPTVLTEEPTEHSDTDESMEEEKRRDGKELDYSRLTSRHSGDRSKIRLRPSEIDQGQRPNRITEDLCRKLARDAFCIANAHPNARTREATTCLCVVLRDEEQSAKKLVFHNGTNEMQRSMRNKAKELRYGIRNAHLAHAEAQFMDFLLYRAKQREDEIRDNREATHPRYTHILGMGCSIKHCQECDVLCKLFLGEGYIAYTSALNQANSNELIPIIDTEPQEEEVVLTMTLPAQKYQVVFQAAAVRSGGERRSTNYRLSDRLQEFIRAKSALALTFSALRFSGLAHVEQAAAQEEEEKDINIDGEYESDAEVVETLSADKKRKATSSP